MKPKLYIVGALLGSQMLAGCALWQDSPMEEAKPEVVVPIASRLDIAWSTNVDQRKPLMPAANTVPVVSGEWVVLGAGDKRVHVYSLNGNEVRRIALRSSCESGALALPNGLVVLGDSDGSIYGIDPTQGTIVWRKQLSSVLLGHPVMAGDNFLIQTADNRIYSFNPNGEKLWSYASQLGGMAMHLGSAPLVKGNRIYAIFSNGDAVALDQKSGNLLWRRQLILDARAAVLRELRVPIADPVFVSGVLVVSFFQGDMIGLNPESGEQLWVRKLSLKSTPLVQGDHLYVSTSNGDVTALDGATGDSLWRQHVADASLVGPAFVNGRLIVADDQGSVYAYTLNGEISDELGLPGRIDHAPVATNNGVLIRNNLGGMYLIR